MAKIVINDGNTFCYIPDEGTAQMQFGAAVEGLDPADLEWELRNPIVGVTLSESGLLEVASTTDVSALTNKEHWVEVVAKIGEVEDVLPVVILKQPDLSANPYKSPEERLDELEGLLADLTEIVLETGGGA